MASFRSRDTKPEITVRRALHAVGRRFRLQRRELPGRPDIVLPKDKIAIFVHGYFWHAHKGCPIARVPRKNAEYWKMKFARNAGRDARAQQELLEIGWTPIIIWECEVSDREAALAKLAELG